MVSCTCHFARHITRPLLSFTEGILPRVFCTLSRDPIPGSPGFETMGTIYRISSPSASVYCHSWGDAPQIPAEFIIFAPYVFYCFSVFCKILAFFADSCNAKNENLQLSPNFADFLKNFADFSEICKKRAFFAFFPGKSAKNGVFLQHHFGAKICIFSLLALCYQVVYIVF